MIDDNPKPRGSLLGLDRLAAEKKKEKQKENETKMEEEPTSKRSKVYSYKTGTEEEAIDIDSTKSNRHYEQQRNKNYRDRDYNLDDKTTPTPHRSYHEKISKNNRYDQDNKKKGVYASTNKCKQLKGIYFMFQIID